jgi:phosphoserine phosphatase
LKQKGCVIGIVSDSYSLVTNHLMHRFQLDFTMANDLEFWRGNTTGEVKIPSAFLDITKQNANMIIVKVM